MRRVRVCYFNTWADGLEEAARYLHRAPELNLATRVADATDATLLRKARLDCDWYAENARCFAALQHPEIEFLPGWIAGPRGVLEVATRPREPGEERWLVFMAHQPQSLGANAGRVCSFLHRAGVRLLFYAFDEASRFMPCFREIAPFLNILVHDEHPLDAAADAALPPECRRIHRSWVANVIPFSASFNEAPEPRIVFLGSQLGLSEHRQRQISFLQERFKDRFVAIHDHSVSIADQRKLNRYQVSLCPEGRKFTTPAMSRTHTDRPFWSGCLGMVPVSENSVAGGRLDELAKEGLVIRYRHGDLADLARACERALAASTAERRRIYDHFNRHETVGAVVANAIAAATR